MLCKISYLDISISSFSVPIMYFQSHYVWGFFPTFWKNFIFLRNNACADLEGGGGAGPPPPLEFAKLNIAEIAGNEKISYFSYLCTSTVIRQGWTPPGKIFWIRSWIKIKFSIYRMDHCPSESSYLTKETDVSNVISAPHTAQGQELLINHCSGYMYLPKFSYFIFY